MTLKSRNTISPFLIVAGPDDNDETDKPQCKDGKDNDGDGKIDFPADPGCDSATDNDEKDKPQCSDGKDNDGDGKIDYPADPGCDSKEDNDEWNSTTSPVLPQLECVYNLGNGKYRAYLGYENTGSETVSIKAGISTATEINKFTPGEANRGQVSSFEVGRKKAVFTVDFDGNSLTWKLQPAGGDPKTVTMSKNSTACKQVKPIAECRDRKAGDKYLTFFGYQNDNPFEIKMNIPAENKFIPAPEDRAQPKSFFNGRVVNAFSVNSSGDLTWKLGTEEAFTISQLPECNPNSAPVCKVTSLPVAACQGNKTTINLDGSLSSDPENDPLTYKWSSDCPGAVISDPTAAQPNLQVDTSSGAAVSCGLWLVVSDGVHQSVPCDIAVKIAKCDVDCAGNPNGSAQVDLCGVCNGNNACLDCNGVPNGGARIDKCGVCGGNDDCVDCAGTPNGNAQVDQCGVCNGDGKSCLECASTDIGAKKFSLDNALNRQRGVVFRLANRLSNASGKQSKLATDAKKEAEVIYQQGWAEIWTGLPDTVINCNNTSVCTESDLSVTINNYSAANNRLHDISLNLLRQIGSLRTKGSKTKKLNDKKYTQFVNDLFDQSQAELASVPRFSSICQ